MQSEVQMEKMNQSLFRQNIIRVDATEKISGQAKYVDDLHFPDQVFIHTIRSEKARAEIISIDFPPLSKDITIISAKDIPGKNSVKMIASDWTFLAENVVNYIGEPILLITGADRQMLKDFSTHIKIHYKETEPVFSLEEAENQRYSPLYGKDNLFASYEISRGDSAKVKKNARYSYEDTYETGYQEQAYLETNGVIATYENDKITVYGSMQCPYYIKHALLQMFGWEEERIRVVQTVTGGAFGGKEEFPSLLAGHAALAAYITRKPARLIYEREEDIICSTKRHPSKIKIKSYLSKDHRVKGIDIDIKLDAGAYTGLSGVVLQRAMFASTGVYHFPILQINGKAYATNKVPSGAFRGFGAPQAFYAIETHMHNTALHFGLDPVEFKKNHLIKKGDPTNTDGLMREDILLPEMLEKIRKESDYQKKATEKQAAVSMKKYGIGMALFFHGCGFTGSGERDIIKAVVKLHKTLHDKVEILISNVEMGQGSLTALRKIVAVELEIPFSQTEYQLPDTDRVPDSGPTVASRTTMVVGALLKKAAARLKEKWISGEEQIIIEKYAHPEYIIWDQDKLKGDAYPGYAWSVDVVEVEVDTLTYEIEILDIYTIVDVGITVDERLLTGQIEGGISQGLGYGYIEVMNCSQGKIRNKNFTDYIIPTSKDYPGVKAMFIDNPSQVGPFGAKGAGELPLVGAAPALTAAVSHALGIKLNRIPLTPEYLRELVENKRS